MSFSRGGGCCCCSCLSVCLSVCVCASVCVCVCVFLCMSVWCFFVCRLRLTDWISKTRCMASAGDSLDQLKSEYYQQKEGLQAALVPIILHLDHTGSGKTRISATYASMNYGNSSFKTLSTCQLVVQWRTKIWGIPQKRRTGWHWGRRKTAKLTRNIGLSSLSLQNVKEWPRQR